MMTSGKMLCYAACSFGLEGIAAREMTGLGLEDVKSQDGRVYFTADCAEIAKANLWLSTVDRIYIVAGQFEAVTFEELFEGIRAIPWADYLPKTARFPVAGDAVQSILHSVSDVQSISKKAIVESMSRVYGVRFFKEAGNEYPIYVTILRNQVTAAINTSGMGLNRRGYRVRNAAAPLRETLAAGLIRITGWYDRPFYDPMCGSGTIAIEAALKAEKAAPGLSRGFAAEKWGEEFLTAFAVERRAARDQRLAKAEAPIFASDIDPKMAEMARFHAERAGVAKSIRFATQDALSVDFAYEKCTLISNPPYAVRLGEQEEVRSLYQKMGEKFGNTKGLKQYYLTADRDFEKAFGIKADKVRKLYNGNIRCDYYQYFKR